MKNTRSLVVSISTIKDLDKIKDDTKYINIDITNVDHSVINYFLLNGEIYRIPYQNILYYEYSHNI